jgi:hypothetical protein
MTPQEQEALSMRHAYRAAVTPLGDGSFAVFSIDLTSESMMIVDNPDDLILAIMSRASMLKRKTPSEETRQKVEALDFDDVDFSKIFTGDT